MHPPFLILYGLFDRGDLYLGNADSAEIVAVVCVTAAVSRKKAAVLGSEHSGIGISACGVILYGVQNLATSL